MEFLLKRLKLYPIFLALGASEVEGLAWYSWANDLANGKDSRYAQRQYGQDLVL